MVWAWYRLEATDLGLELDQKSIWSWLSILRVPNPFKGAGAMKNLGQPPKTEKQMPLNMGKNKTHGWGGGQK